MTDWAKLDLEGIAASDDLHISPLREDAKTYGTPTWIWSVVVDGGLFVRAYHGHGSRWYQAALGQKAGRITAAGMRREVSFESVNTGQDAIDEAYRRKYGDSTYLASMIGPRARAATVRITPKREI